MRRSRRALRRAATAFALIALAAALGALGVRALVRREVRARLAELGRVIGRPVGAGAVTVSLWPTFTVALEDVHVDDAPGRGGAPLFTARTARASLAAWRLLASRGRTVDVRAIELVAPALSVERLASGQLSTDDVAARLAERRPTSPRPLDEQLQRLAGVSVARVSVVDGEVRLADGASGRRFAVTQLGAEVRDAALGREASLVVDAAVDAPSRNVHVSLRAIPLATRADDDPMVELRAAALDVRGLSLDALAPFAPSIGGLALAAATVDAKVAIERAAAAAGAATRLDADLHLARLTLRSGAGVGQPAEVRLRVRLGVDRASGDARLEAGELAVDDMALVARADLRHLRVAPEVHDLVVEARSLTFDGILRHLPPSTLPDGVTLEGPIALRAGASGSPARATVEGALDLGAATVRLPGIDKPRGVRAGITLRGEVGPGGLRADRLAATFGPLAVVARGTIRSPRDLALDVESAPVELARLAPLLPAVTAALPRGTRATVRVRGSVRRAAPTGRRAAVATTVIAHVEVARAALSMGGGAAPRDDAARAPSAPTSGAASSDGGAAAASAHRAGHAEHTSDAAAAEGGAGGRALVVSGAATADVTLGIVGVKRTLDAAIDLTATRVRAAGAVDKAGGAPARVTLLAELDPPRVTLRRGRVELGGVAASLRGALDLLSGKIDVRLDGGELDVAALAHALPALASPALPPGLAAARLRFAGQLAGTAYDLSHLAAHLDLLDAQLAGGHGHGHADLPSLAPPLHVAFALDGDGLDLDRLLVPAVAPSGDPQPAFVTAPAPGAPLRGPIDVTARAAAAARRVRALPDITGHLHVAHARVRGVPLADVDADLALERGRLSLPSLKGRVFDGSAVVWGSSIDFAAAPPCLVLRLRLEGVDLAALAAAGNAARSGHHLAGRGLVELQIEGPLGDDLAHRLSGPVRLDLAEVRFRRDHPLLVTVMNPLLGRLLGGRVRRPRPGGLHLSHLTARFHLAGGQLVSDEPLHAVADAGSLDLTGHLGLDQTGALDGTLTIAPADLERMSRGRLRAGHAVSLPLHVDRVPAGWEVRILHPARSAAKLLGALLSTH